MPPDTPPALSLTDRPRRATAAGLLALALAAGHARAEAAGGDTEALAKQAQNPIATGFLATSLRRDLMVGFGPTVTLPTATAKDLGTGKWSAGPARPTARAGRRATGSSARWSTTSGRSRATTTAGGSTRCWSSRSST